MSRPLGFPPDQVIGLNLPPRPVDTSTGAAFRFSHDRNDADGGGFVRPGFCSCGETAGRPSGHCSYAGCAPGFGPRAVRFGLVTVELGSEQVVLLAEATLALLLFSDACGIDLSGVRKFAALPTRLLLIGLPLSILLGTVLTSLLLTDLALIEAAMVATMLTPTDAALGQAVITSPSVPLRIRETLDFESGLNDGLAVPVFTTLALAWEVGSGTEEAELSISEAVVGGLAELGASSCRSAFCSRAETRT